MLFPSLLLTTAPLGRRPRAFAAVGRRPPWPGHPGPPLAGLRLGIGPWRRPLSFPLSPGRCLGPGGPNRVAAGALSTPPLFPSARRKKAGRFCPKAPGLLSFFLRVLPPFVPFAKETLPFTIFQNKSLPHINVILIVPLTLPKIVQIFLEITTRSLPSQE